jgi:alkaline phosphatase D
MRMEKGQIADDIARYIPDGNSKFGAVEIETPEHSENSLLKYRLFIDGKEVWSYSITSPPAQQTGFFDGVWA